MYTTTPNGDFDSGKDWGTIMSWHLYILCLIHVHSLVIYVSAGRQSYMPLPAEPTAGTFPRTYAEVGYCIILYTSWKQHRGARITLKLNVVSLQQRVPRPGYGFQPQMGNDRSNPGMREGYYGSPPYYSGGSNAVEAPAPVTAPAPVPTPVV